MELDDATFELVRDLTIRAGLWDRRAERYLRQGRDRDWLKALVKRDRANSRRERWLYGPAAGERFAIHAERARARLVALMGANANV